MTPHPNSQSGNMLIYILGAIFLLGLLIVIIKGNFQEGTGIDPEKVVIEVGQVQKQAAELERAVGYLIQNGVSESDIRFAHPDANVAYGDITVNPKNQVFGTQGGGAEYKLPAANILSTPGMKWEFFAFTHIKDIGTDTAGTRKAELVAVVPNVTRQFCERINFVNNQVIDLTLNTDPTANGCIYTPGSRFAGTYVTGAGANTLDDTLMSKHPAREACVHCQSGGFHYYRVLLGR